jgi:transposase-like protein
MEFQVNAAGKRIYASEFKKSILDELRAGATVHELGRKYQIPIQNIVYWKKSEELAVLGKGREAKPEEAVPLTEYKKALEEIKNLRRSLVNMTVDRDILKEAVDIGIKKKWISPAK